MKAQLLDSKVLRQWTAVHPARNLAWLTLDYLTAAVIIIATICFWSQSASWGLPWIANAVAGVLAVILLGAVQHRIALMGHEASHYMLYPNRKVNDFLAEVFCFFPIFGTLTQYRAKHLGHHLYPNDPEHDPNMAGTRAKRLYARFPMPKPSFVYHYYLKFFWPPFVFHNLLDLMRVVTMGFGLSPLPEDGARDTEDPPKPRRFYQNATLFGILYLLLFIGAIHTAVPRGSLPFLYLLLGGVYAIGLLGWWFLPESWIRRPGGKLAYSHKVSAFLRLTVYTLFFGMLGSIHTATGVWAGGYFLLLWVPALVYVLPYLMLLREVYQHANADRGDLTNSRVIYADPFTRWALLGYGNDVHLVHHIYPNIPHYSLTEAHDRMMEECDDYNRLAEEAYGTFAGGKGKQTLLDALAANHPRDEELGNSTPGETTVPALDNR